MYSRQHHNYIGTHDLQTNTNTNTNTMDSQYILHILHTRDHNDVHYLISDMNVRICVES